jgi:hypothetical protein
MLLLEKAYRPKAAPEGHFLADDLESHFHGLFHEVVMHLPLEEFQSSEDFEALQNKVKEYFDQSMPNYAAKRYTGGAAKSQFLFYPTPRYTVIDNEPLSILITKLRRYFQDRYIPGNYATPEGEAELSKQYNSAKPVLDLFDEALDEKNYWPEDDKIELDIFNRDYKGNPLPASGSKRKSVVDEGETGSSRKRAKSEHT